MNPASSTIADAGFDAGEADYFSAILAMQNATEHSRALPFVLTQLISSFQNTIASQGVEWHWPNAGSMNVADLAAFGAKSNVIVFQLIDKDENCIIACDQAAMISLSMLLLGSKPEASNRIAGRIERQIIEGFFQLMNAGFKLVDPSKTQLIWHDYAGARLPFGDGPDSAFCIVMINRRADVDPKPQFKATDDEQKSRVRRALGQGVLCVDYVLSAGQVSLAMLRNLNPGSVLALGSLDDLPLEARANGKPVFAGLLKLSPDIMRFGVTRVLTEAGHV